jgi:hypothetical protein
MPNKQGTQPKLQMNETNSTDRRYHQRTSDTVIPTTGTFHIEDVKLTSAENKAIRPDSTVAKIPEQQGNRS